MKLIQDFSSIGIRFKDEAGESVFIDFKECNYHWILFRGRTENLTNEEINDLMVRDNQ